MQRIVEHQDEQYISEYGNNKYLHFYESLEKPGYYFINDETLEGAMEDYHIYNHTQEEKWGNGAPRVPLAEPISVGPFRSNYDTRFEFFIMDNYIEEHIPHERESFYYKAWYKFKAFEPEKWLDDFLKYIKMREAEYEKKNNTPSQLSLF